MTWDDLIYALLLVSSVLCGPVLSKISNSILKQTVFASVGLIFCLCVCGYFIWHSLLTTFISILLFHIVSKRYIHIVTFIWVFSYLAFFRTANLWGFQFPSPHSNAVQLLITLRLIGIAFEIYDSSEYETKLKNILDKDKFEHQLKVINPTSVDIFLYIYCYAGLLTGPYFKYMTYFDMIQLKSNYGSILSIQAISKKLAKGFFYGIIYLVFSHFYYIEYARTDTFYEHSLIYRFYFMVMMFMVFRCRVYFAWIISECVCMVVGLGAYPVISKPKCGQGPTDLAALQDFQQRDKTQQQARPEDYNFETIHNIDVYGCELAPTVREGMKSWNMSVQYWLANCVYRRISTPNRTVRTAITMAVSAYWHGVHPGYYLSFLTIPLCLAAESALERLLNRVDPAAVWSFWPRWFFKMRSFDYMCMGFLLLGGGVTLQYWASIYWCVHVTCIVFLLLEKVVGKSGKDKRLRGSESADASTLQSN